jgi:hypothetical protein
MGDIHIDAASGSRVVTYPLFESADKIVCAADGSKE